MPIIPSFHSPLYPPSPPLLMLPAPPQPKLLCAPKIAGLLPARAALPPIEVTPPQSMWVKRMTKKELYQALENALGYRPRTIEEMNDELRELGLEVPEPDSSRVLPSTAGPIEITARRPLYFKRMTQAEMDAMFGPLLTIEEFDEKWRKEHPSRRTVSDIESAEGDQP